MRNMSHHLDILTVLDITCHVMILTSTVSIST